MCSVLEQMLDEAFGELTTGGASDSMRQTVRRVQEYIDENYFDAVSLTSISQMFHVERSYLSKSFKQVSGSNLMLAIAKKRIEKAADYIRQRDLSLAEVSSLVGYEEYAYFNRVFHKIMGVSPSEFKASVRRSPVTRTLAGLGAFVLCLVCAGCSPSGRGAAGASDEAKPHKLLLSVLAGQSTSDAGIEEMINDLVGRKLPSVSLDWERMDWGEKFQSQMQAKFGQATFPIS